MEARTIPIIAKFCIPAFLALVSVNAVAPTALAQQQAARIQFLTTLPVRTGYEKVSAVQQYPNKGALVVPDGLRIKPPFAWNRDDKYVPPDFEAFFPDDPQGGKQLDALFTGRLGGHHAPEDLLAAVRQGLRHTTVYKSQLLGQIGSFVWNATVQDPRAIELLYHASDVRGPVAHEGMYYGLTVLTDRTPNVMRTIVEGYSRFGGSIQVRIPWGFRTYGDNQQTVSLLADLLRQPEGLSDNAVTAALDLYREAAGRTYPDMQSVAARGRFVVALTHNRAREASQLQEYLERSIGKQAVESFVLRIADGEAVGVGLINGVGNREKIAEQLKNDPEASLVFVETFAPAVLQYRQLREFASFLPGGLPERARPKYAPVPDDVRLAWNARGGYQPPNFAAYFPDDQAAGLALDQLYEQRETTQLTAREQLIMIRQGLRRAKHPHRLCRWISSIAGWPDDPMANEIFFHAADPRAAKELRYSAIYFGLSGLVKKPPNVLRLFGEIVRTEPIDRGLGSETVGRVIWSLSDEAEKATMAGYVDDALKHHEQYPPEKLGQLTKIYEGLTGSKPSTYEQYAASMLKVSKEWRDATKGDSEPDPAAYAKAFRELYESLGRDYAHFEVKEIDWKAVGAEFLPRSERLQSRAEFCRLCQELVARLEDSHAYLFKGTVEPESIAVPRWDPGFACLFDDSARPIVYHVDSGSPAEAAGLRAGMTVTRLNGRDIQDVIADQMQATKKYAGYSSDRYLRYHTGQWLGRQMEHGALVRLATVDVEGHEHHFEMKASLNVRYLQRLPVPIAGIHDSASFSWKRLDDETGYLYVRKIRADLPQQLDSAIKELQSCRGLIIDVRGNSGGGFDATRAVRNFNLEDNEEPERPRFAGRIAVLIDSRCISAGEGWVSWFRANDRAKFFGETTAGASSRKTTIDVLDGTYKVIFSVKAYRGFLDRPIERIGIQPDVEVHHTAESLSKQIDAVLTAARDYLDSGKIP